MKISVLIVFVIFLTFSTVKSDKNWSADKNPQKWLDDGKKNIDRMLIRKLNGNLAKNVM
jgi:hypothetical protein